MAYKVSFEGAGGVETLTGDFRCLSRADFEAFTDRLFLAAEELWPTVEAAEEAGQKPFADLLTDDARSELAARAQAALKPQASPSRTSPAIAGEGGARDIAATDDDLPPLTFNVALHALRGAMRRAKMLALKEQGYTLQQIAVGFGTSAGAVSVALSEARHERRKAQL